MHSGLHPALRLEPREQKEVATVAAKRAPRTAAMPVRAELEWSPWEEIV